MCVRRGGLGWVIALAAATAGIVVVALSFMPVRSTADTEYRPVTGGRRAGLGVAKASIGPLRRLGPLPSRHCATGVIGAQRRGAQI
jgi:hypothetical protein